MSKVYFTKDISPAGLAKVYAALGTQLHGKVAVKISTGEAGNQYFLDPKLIEGLVTAVKGTIVECNTAYAGSRDTNEAHWQTVKDHGFAAIAPVDLMDEEGEMALPVGGGHKIEVNYVGGHLARYDSMLVLSHFKGHPMGGYGGALKNVAIGIASAHGKQWIHTSGSGEESFEALMTADHDSFLESMADACKAVFQYMGTRNLAYVSVANNLSVDCDCCSNAAAPEMGDIGIFASLDPVAIDQACVDAVYASSDPGKKALIQRIESLNGIHTIEAAAAHHLGSREYELVDLDAQEK